MPDLAGEKVLKIVCLGNKNKKVIDAYQLLTESKTTKGDVLTEIFAILTKFQPTTTK